MECDDPPLDDRPVLALALMVLNQPEAEEIIKRPTTGGSIALAFHSQMILTDDLDIFCHFEELGLAFRITLMWPSTWTAMTFT